MGNRYIVTGSQLGEILTLNTLGQNAEVEKKINAIIEDENAEQKKQASIEKYK